MVERHLCEQKLASIRDHVARIREKLPATADTLRADRDAQESVAFNLFLAFQDALDLAAHIIADSSWKLPASAREHFEILQEHGVLSAAAAQAMASCAGLRNLIAHAYGSVDLTRLHSEVPAGLAALEDFCAEVARLA